MHPAFFLQALYVPYVDQAPDTRRFSRRKADRVARFVQVTPHSIYPAKTETFVQRFGVSNTLLARGFLVKPNQQLTRSVVVLLEPLPELCGRSEEPGFHRGRRTGACPGSQAGWKVELASH